MIKLDLPEKPNKLTLEKQDELTKIYNEKGTAVWRQCGIPESLFAMSHNKCSFSEIMLNEEGKYGEIEHFYPKSIYADKVVEWGNLLPISNICNRTKGDTDPSVKPLINPLVDNPKDYLFIQQGRLFPKNQSPKAINTLKEYGLNTHLRDKRFEVEGCIEKTLIDIHAYHTTNIELCSSRLKELMCNGTRTYEYSATKSTYILKSAIYNNLKLYMTLNKLWGDDFETLEEELRFCSLPK